jgi:DNA-directed RNA polymerase subunit F
MNIINDAQARTVTIEMSPQEYSRYAKINQRKPSSFLDAVMSWTKNTIMVVQEEDRDNIRQKIKDLTPQQIEDVRVMLRL